MRASRSATDVIHLGYYKLSHFIFRACKWMRENENFFFPIPTHPQVYSAKTCERQSRTYVLNDG